MSRNAERHIITNLNAAIRMCTHTHAHMWSCVHMHKVLPIAFVYQPIHRVSVAQQLCVSMPAWCSVQCTVLCPSYTFCSYCFITYIEVFIDSFICLLEALGRDWASPLSFPSSTSCNVMVTWQIYTTNFNMYIYAHCQKTVNTYLIFIVLVSKLLLLLKVSSFLLV